MLQKNIIDTYIENGSIIETAKKTGTSTVKVRKILITEGLWKSATSEKVRGFLDKGMTTEEIACELHMSVKNVQAYMPYERGAYGGDEPSSDAMRSEIYRKRMKQAAEMQVVKNKTIESDYLMVKNKKTDVTSILKLHIELNLKNRDRRI